MIIHLTPDLIYIFVVLLSIGFVSYGTKEYNNVLFDDLLYSITFVLVKCMDRDTRASLRRITVSLCKAS